MQYHHKPLWFNRSETEMSYLFVRLVLSLLGTSKIFLQLLAQAGGAFDLLAQLLDLLAGVGCAAAQSPLQFCKIRRLDENEHGIHVGRLHGKRTIELELEDDVASLRMESLDLASECSVAITGKFHMLEHLVTLDGTVKIGA